MPTLHIVRQSAFNSDDFAQCLQVLRDNDVIAFIDDGCYNLHHQLINTINSEAGIQLNVIDKHAQARAITIDESLYTVINMNDLVNLTLTTSRVITWQ
ncbi:sulfurtransferase complex subunit TusB [Candidatus Colwellia aromaticivorans]|uniref:sulfurtransferase complex subunit TusB n=1 Tax=Candidatus Colwellia aromaticivorans TaxID=2267621 RepID=UPI000DF25B0A|nr:sulfurtransferase complex subunit TusB [Candidatus Colwellia aromaticivorans]